MKIPFVDLKAQYERHQTAIDSAIADVITETSFIGGKYVKAFEDQFAHAYGAGHVIPCANGTDSLYIIMKMLGIGAGDEVVTAANSWISSSETITQAGARPVFIDVDPVYYSLDEKQLESVITPNTRAVIVVHLQGQPCEMETILAICKHRGIHVIEDCAQAHFSEYKDIKTGLMGKAASFSFFPGKNLGAYGDAGCILTNDGALAEKCRMYANHGALKKHHHQIEGINSRMDALQASILSSKLPFIQDWTRKRIHNAELYTKYLAEIKELTLPQTRPGCKHSFHLYVVRAQRRDQLMANLQVNGIETLIHYPTPLPFLPAYRYLGHQPADFPVSHQLQPEILSLPMYPELTEDMIIYIAECIKSFYHDTAGR